MNRECSLMEYQIMVTILMNFFSHQMKLHIQEIKSTRNEKPKGALGLLHQPRPKPKPFPFPSFKPMQPSLSLVKNNFFLFFAKFQQPKPLLFFLIPQLKFFQPLSSLLHAFL